MDLLGSIISSMDKPPAANEKQKEQVKVQMAQIEKMKNHQKQELIRFRKYVEERLDRLGRDPKRYSMQFQPLDKVYRSVVHDVAEVAGLSTMSFGEEGVDRYIMVYKRDHPPSEDEISARRDGVEWNEAKAQEYRENRAKEILIEKDKAIISEKIEPTSNYKDKYVHLIGQEAALEAARKTESNKSYGFVPSANKKDIRSIEQTLADIQAKKRIKLAHNTETTATESTSTANSTIPTNIESPTRKDKNIAETVSDMDGLTKNSSASSSVSHATDKNV